MTKLSKQYYYTASHEKKINCYHILLPRKIVNKANIEDDDELIVSESHGNIIIKKKWHCTCMECDTEWDSGQDYGIWALCPKCHCGDVKFQDNSELDDN